MQNIKMTLSSGLSSDQLTGRRSKLAPIVILCFATLLWLVQIGDYLNGTVDDVFITLRVVNNVVEGNWFVYNVGENVEGHSNWSWVAMLATIGSVASIDSSSMDMLWVSKLLALLFSALAIMSTYKLALRFSNSHTTASISVLFLTATSAFGFWSVCGLETPLVLFLVTSIAVQYFDLKRSSSLLRQLLVGLSLALLAVTRPEGAAYGVIILSLIFYKERRFSGHLLTIGLSFILPLLAFLSWRYSTYGLLVPNTYYAKVGGGWKPYLFGIKYSLESLIACFAPFLLFALFIDRSLFKTEAGKDTARLMALMLGFVYFFTVYSGADWMPAYRFILPALGVGTVLGVIAGSDIFARIGVPSADSKWRPVMCLLVCFIAAAAITFEGRIRTKAQTFGAVPHALSSTVGHPLHDHAKAAEWLHTHRDSIDVFAAGEAGLLGFQNPGMTLVDLNGLMDRTIASARSKIVLDIDYVMKRDPDCFILFAEELDVAVVGAAASSSYSTIVMNDARFRDAYELRDTYGNLAIYMRKRPTI